MGRIGGREAAAVLRGLKVPEALAWTREDALLRCADDLAAGKGKEKEEALEIYRTVREKSTAPSIRGAACMGILRALGPAESVKETARLLGEEDPACRRTAARFLADLPPDTNLDPVLQALSSLPPESKVQVLGVLAFRKEKAAAAVAAKEAGSAEEAVRIASLAALGDVGGPEQVMLLARAAATGGKAGDAAAESLARLPGREADAAVTAALSRTEGPVRAALIQALAERKTPGTLPLFLGYVDDPDSKVRLAALRALEERGDASVLPALVERLLALKHPADQEALERTLHAVCDRVEPDEARTRELRAALPEAPPAARASIYRLLGAFPCDEGLQSLLSGLKDHDPAARKAALVALTEWPDARAAAPLLHLLTGEENGEIRSLALRGYLHGVKASEGKDPSANRTAFEAALRACRTAQERAMVLSSLSSLHESWIPAFLAPFLSDPRLHDRAVKVRDEVVDALAKKVPHEAQGRPVSLNFPYSRKYTAGGPGALTDGKYGSDDLHDGRWQGFEGNDLVAVVDLGKEISVERIRVGFLEDLNSWIFLPLTVDMALSGDGKTFEQVAHFVTDLPEKMRPPSVKEFISRLSGKTARYVRVTAKNVGTCPAWHPGNGGPAWLFVDEIQVNPRFGP